MERSSNRRKYRDKSISKSSASSHLKGLLYHGKPISGVWKVGSNKRLIKFNDGSEITVNKKTIASLSKVQGTLKQFRKYFSSSPQEKERMVGKSKKRQESLKLSSLKKLRSERGQSWYNILSDVLSGKRSLRESLNKRKKVNLIIKNLQVAKAGNIYKNEPGIYKYLPGASYHKRTSRKVRFPRWVIIKKGGKRIRVPMKNPY